MLGVAHFKHHIDIGLFGRYIVEVALVIDFNDVGVFLADQGADGGKRARNVRDLDPYPDKTAFTCHAAHQNLCQQAGIDIATTDDQADLLALEAIRMIEQGGKWGSTSAFDNAFFDFDQHLD